METKAAASLIEKVPSEARGKADFGWLQSRHSFSFGNWYDPRRMGIGPLRVLNDDWVAGGGGFPPHPHRDMEIISYVLEGALAHDDSGGNAGIVRADEVQFMRAGVGVAHSEMNASQTEPVHFLQVWLVPRSRGRPVVHDHRALDLSSGGWVTIAGRGGFEIDSDATMVTAEAKPGARLTREIGPGRQGYLFVARGAIRAGGASFEAGDAAHWGPGSLEFVAPEGARILFFDLPSS